MDKTKYTFNLNNHKSNNVSDIDYLNNLINDNIVKNNPYLVDNGYKVADEIANSILSEIFTYSKPKPKKTTTTITFNLKKKEPTDILEMLGLITNKSKIENIFDYLLPDGTPVKIFDDRIQIGFTTIPLFASNGFYSSLGETTKKHITETYIILG